MVAAAVVRARVDEELKVEATELLSTMGLTVSDAIRLMLTRVVVDRALPFSIKAPNAETQVAMRDAELGNVTRFATVEDLFADLNN